MKKKSFSDIMMTSYKTCTYRHTVSGKVRTDSKLEDTKNNWISKFEMILLGSRRSVDRDDVLCFLQ